VSYFQLGEADSTTASNAVLGAPHGTYGPGIWRSTPGIDPGDTSYRQDGTVGGYVSVPDDAATAPTGDFAVEAWVKPDAIGTQQGIVEKFGDPSGGWNGFALAVQPSGVVEAYQVGAPGTVRDLVVSTQKLESGSWYHLVLTADALTVSDPRLRLYINGQQAASAPVRYAMTRSGQPLFIGAHSGSLPGYGTQIFNGRIDEVALYDHPLTAQQISDHFSRAMPIPENATPPTVSGTTAVGATLTAAPGRWSPPTTPSFDYQWLRCDTSGHNCNPISGATASTYTVQQADLGVHLRVRVTATNNSGTAHATSAASREVSAYASAVMASSPVSYFRLGEADSTTALNAVAEAPNGTYRPGIWRSTPGIDPSDTSYRQDGTGSGYVTVENAPATAPTGDFAVEAWVKPDAIGTQQAIVEKFGDPSGGSNGFALAVQPSGAVEGYLAGAPGTGNHRVVSTPRELLQGRWYHIVLTGDAPTTPNPELRLYIDGEPGGSVPVRHAMTRSERPLFIGAHSGSLPGYGTQLFNGRIDEVAIYDHPLTAQQISDHFSRAMPIPENATPPTVSGTTAVGATLTASPGRWSPPVTPSFGYQWLRCDTSGCNPISGATASTYTVQQADLGVHLRVRVTATNNSGTGAADSDATYIPPPPPPPPPPSGGPVELPDAPHFESAASYSGDLEALSDDLAEADPRVISRCLPAANGASLRLYLLDGTTTTTSVAPVGSPGCPTGKFRISLMESLTINGVQHRLYRGGDSAAHPTGFIRVSDLGSHQLGTVNEALKRNPTSTLEHGRPPAGCNSSIRYQSDPKELSNQWTYKSGERGSTWWNYGWRPALFPTTPNGAIHNSMLWNLPHRVDNDLLDQRGGGIVRAQLKQGQLITPCDVHPVSQRGYRRLLNGEWQPHGWTRWFYGKTMTQANGPIYGWFMYSFSHFDHPEVQVHTVSNG
jgi:hypothetical protein